MIPAQDQGRLITTPYQPQLQGFGQLGIQNVNGQNGATGTGFGNGPGTGSGTFGSSSSGIQEQSESTGDRRLWDAESAEQSSASAAVRSTALAVLRTAYSRGRLSRDC